MGLKKAILICLIDRGIGTSLLSGLLLSTKCVDDIPCQNARFATCGIKLLITSLKIVT